MAFEGLDRTIGRYGDLNQEKVNGILQDNVVKYGRVRDMAMYAHVKKT